MFYSKRLKDIESRLDAAEECLTSLARLQLSLMENTLPKKAPKKEKTKKKRTYIKSGKYSKTK